MTIFDGNAFAAAQETTLKLRMAQLAKRKVAIKVAAILFTQDAGSQLYSRLKKEAAERIGIEYELYSYSLIDSKESVLQKIAALNADPSVTGIIIQKPWTSLWTTVTGQTKADFEAWWAALVTSIAEPKDVDGLHPHTLAAIKRGTWRAEGKVLPATARAVMAILESAHLWRPGLQYTIIGKSDILGKPLYYELVNKKCNVEMIGSKELKAKIEQKKYLFEADVVVSATGRQHLVTGELVKDGVALVDVGEPKPDVDQVSVSAKASFLTPVPGGVGPVTVVSLMANALDLVV